MRDLILSADMTLDGFMADSDNELGYTVGDDEVEQMLTDELTSRVDSIVVGRKSFHPMAAHWTAATGSLAEWMNTTPKFLLSNTLDDASEWENTTVLRGDGATEVQRLKDGPGKALVVFGGVQTVANLVAASVVDELWLKVNPVAIGRGGAIFGELKDRVGLELLSARSYPSGTVAVVYRAMQR